MLNINVFLKISNNNICSVSRKLQLLGGSEICCGEPYHYLCCHLSFFTVTHSLKYFYTSSSGIHNFPEYLSVGYVDDVQISHCDSVTNTSVAKQEWMKKVTDEYPDYWRDETKTCIKKQQAFKESIRVTKDRFNQTKGWSPTFFLFYYY